MNDSDGAESRYIFQEQENGWLKVGNIHTFATLEDQNHLTVVQTGNVANVNDAGNGKQESFIYSGTKWIPLGSTDKTVGNITELNTLTAQAGDVANVDAGNGLLERYLYTGSEWKPFVKNGNAGTITADTIRMENKSNISTSSAGSGKAGGISLTTDQLQLGSSASVSSKSNSTNFGGQAGTITIKA